MRESYKRGALIAALVADIIFNALTLAEIWKRNKAWKDAVAEDTEKAKTSGVSGD